MNTVILNTHSMFSMILLLKFLREPSTASVDAIDACSNLCKDLLANRMVGF